MVGLMDSGRLEHLVFSATTFVSDGYDVRDGDVSLHRLLVFVTWPARRAYRMFKCYRENGLKYT